MALHRILTEDVNRDRIIAIIEEYFGSFTIISVIGYWQGQPENSLIIEIDTDWNPAIYDIADKIKVLNEQQAVLVQRFDCQSGLR